ncbi:MAG: ABC transporter ATP-binding protein [bacterium]
MAISEPTTESAKSELTNGAIVRRLLGLAWHYRLGCLRVIGLQVLLLALSLGALGLTGVGIDYILQQLAHTARMPHWPFGLTPPSFWPPMAVLAVLAAVVVVMAVLRGWLTYRYSLANVRLVQRGIVVDLRSRIYDKLQRLSFRFFDDNVSGTLINRVTSDVQSVRLFVDGVVIQTLMLLISLAFYAGYMAHICPRLMLACLAPLPLMAVISLRFARAVRPAYLADRDRVDRMILDLSEAVQGVQVIKGFTREKEEEQCFASVNRAVLDQKLRIFRLLSRYSPSVNLVSHLSVAILLGYGGWLVMRDELALGSGLIVFLGLLQRFSGQVNSITTITDSVQQSLAAARRVFEVLDAPPEVQSHPRALRKPKLAGRIQFENVAFEYEPGAAVLTGITLDIPAGNCTGILGTTGSGKSTLLSLIPRFYDVTGGRLCVDGVDLRRISLEDLRRQVGIVFQESYLFSNTVAANIAFGAPSASRERIEQAARLASAHEFIERLPKGYDTVLSEAGSDLSGGQRQRLAIARAILLDPPILLLDDPTAAVDAETEREILDAIESAMRGRTTLLVTHRISALRRADRIVVLHRGRIEQIGTHGELTLVKGTYRRSANLQTGDDEPAPLPPAGGGIT